MKIFKAIDAFVAKHTLLSNGQTIIIGLSGGPDSVFLLYYLLAKKELFNLKIIAAHLNHEWRDSAQVDEVFCVQLCNRLNIPLICKKLSELNLTVKSSGSKEQDARNARRRFFAQLAHEHAADAIALAHHLDDQTETFFIRLFRGAGLSGLIGIRPKSESYIRPLLCISKNEILAHLTQRNISYVIDPTNESTDFLRNRIRHKVMPALRETDNRFTQSFTKTLNRLQEIEQFLVKLTEPTFTDIASFDPIKKRYIIDKHAFLALDPVIRYRILVHWFSLEKAPFPVTQGFFDEIIRFIQQPESKTHSACTAWQLVKTKYGLHLSFRDEKQRNPSSVDIF
jgi:tRNA(Ile)-lysidine synthase